ncbi:MAG: FprA family A-type flavoprotein, partial [Dehalococcoidia bacterium]|nr:FprA family A-type flavoprotein [Dehalococcoidia bacterium]
MKARMIRDGIFWVGAVDWDRRLFDSLIPLPDGTSYNAYLVRGSEKTALIDTVDPTMTAVLFDRLDDLGIGNLDFVVVNHAEQDHSGSLPQVLARHPETKIVTNQICKRFLIDLLHVDEGRFITVEDGETISLGDKHLQFIFTPLVHWPETMGTYVPEDRILFSGDFFGSHIATSKLYAGEEEGRVYEATKRYFAEIMMPFRPTIRKNLDKVQGLSLDLIAPTHGVIRDDIAAVLECHRDWVSDNVSNTVVLPFVSMHGSTLAMVDCLTETLVDQGVRVEKINLTGADLGKLAEALVDAATIVIGSPTVLGGAHPLAVSAAFLANALRPKVKFASIIGSYGWGGKTVEQITGLIS